MLSAFRSGSRLAFDERWWLETFNSADRPVQLNCVVLGLNELGLHPMLDGEDWQPINNPFVINGIENKLHKASKYIERRHKKTIHISKSKLALMDWGLTDLATQAPMNDQQDSPSIAFMRELPHPASNTPSKMVEVKGLLFMYYENVRTIGEMTENLPAVYRYPQVAVVSRQREPLLIIRIEESALGAMLCAIEPSGTRFNLGSFARTDSDTFLRKAAKSVSELVADRF
jgi:hypothetical protein